MCTHYFIRHHLILTYKILFIDQVDFGTDIQTSKFISFMKSSFKKVLMASPWDLTIWPLDNN